MVFVSFYRPVCEAANSQYCFYSEAENQHIRPAGATRTDLREIWHGRAARGRVHLATRNFAPIGARGGYAASKCENFHFFGRVDEKILPHARTPLYRSIVNVIASPKMARNEQVCAHRTDSYRRSTFSKISLGLLCMRNCTNALILRFFTAASDGAIAERQILKRTFSSIS